MVRMSVANILSNGVIQSQYISGGGGGSVGPNLAVSTLVVNFTNDPEYNEAVLVKNDDGAASMLFQAQTLASIELQGEQTTINLQPSSNDEESKIQIYSGALDPELGTQNQVFLSANDTIFGAPTARVALNGYTPGGTLVSQRVFREDDSGVAAGLNIYPSLTGVGNDIPTAYIKLEDSNATAVNSIEILPSIVTFQSPVTIDTGASNNLVSIKANNATTYSQTSPNLNAFWNFSSNAIPFKSVGITNTIGDTTQILMVEQQPQNLAFNQSLYSSGSSPSLLSQAQYRLANSGTSNSIFFQDFTSGGSTRIVMTGSNITLNSNVVVPGTLQVAGAPLAAGVMSNYTSAGGIATGVGSAFLEFPALSGSNVFTTVAGGVYCIQGPMQIQADQNGGASYGITVGIDNGTDDVTLVEENSLIYTSGNPKYNVPFYVNATFVAQGTEARVFVENSVAADAGATTDVSMTKPTFVRIR